MSKGRIIVPGQGELDLSRLPKGIRRMAERDGMDSVMEALGRQSITRAEVPAVVQHLVNPIFDRVFGAYRETSISIIAIAEVLKTKGLVTEEEIEAAEEAVVDRIKEKAMEAMKQNEEQIEKDRVTPNSPAFAEAVAQAPADATVGRLDEPDHVTVEDEETSGRILLEG